MPQKAARNPGLLKREDYFTAMAMHNRVFGGVAHRWPTATAASLLLFALLACSPHMPNDAAPLVAGGPSFSVPSSSRTDASRWWLAFDDPILLNLVERALADNLTLKQGYARLRQARAIAGQATADRFPAMDGGASENAEWTADGAHDENIVLELTLSWEIDLWQRLAAAQKAAILEQQASADDLQAAALLLSSQVTDVYCQLVEQRLQADLLAEQIESSRTYLELIRLRFANGASHAVDVLQQQQQLAAIQAQRPLVQARIRTLENRLQVLLGQSPEAQEIDLAGKLPSLPPLPAIGIPADLLLARPDLRVLHRRLQAADYRVAGAVADRLPRLTIGGAGGFSGKRLTGDGLFLSLFGEALAPLIDWGKRKAEVDRREAMVEELAASYSERYLTAIEEVENALWQERRQEEHLGVLAGQLGVARLNLSESRNRYLQGATDYLPVLTALQSLQRLERDILLKKRELLSFRILLYRALGGSDPLPLAGKEAPQA